MKSIRDCNTTGVVVIFHKDGKEMHGDNRGHAKAMLFLLSGQSKQKYLCGHTISRDV